MFLFNSRLPEKNHLQPYELREKYDINHVIKAVLTQYVNQTTLSSEIPLSLVKTFSAWQDRMDWVWTPLM